MKIQTKLVCAVGALLPAVAQAAGKSNFDWVASAIIGIAVVVLILWLVWRAFVFVVLLLRPAKKAIAPFTAGVERHLEETMRRTGVGTVYDISKSLDKKINNAVDATQRGIDERRNK